MNVPPNPCVLVAVQPLLLGLMIADILTHLGADEVMQFDGGTPLGAEYDAALISGIPATGVAARVIIELPDNEGSSGIGRITNRSGSHTVIVDGLNAILGLLDRYSPAEIRRAARE